MNSRIARAVAVLVIALAIAGCASAPGGDGWIALVDGNNGMNNFTISGATANWRAEGGAITADKLVSGKGASVLVSNQSFRDLEMYVEFQASDDTNRGAQTSEPDLNMVNTASGAFEVQIWDKNPNQLYTTGSLVNVASTPPVHKAGNGWNTFEVHARGSEITVKMNGVVTASTSYAKTHEGRIGLQFNAGPVKFRKILVRPL